MNRTWKFIIVIAAISMIAAPALAQKGGDPFSPHDRECISPEWVVAVNGHSNPDLAVANTLVARAGGHADLVYVHRERIPHSTQEYLRRKYDRKGGPAALYVVGGSSAVSEDVVTELEELGVFHTVRRVNGATRSQTAAIANFISGSCK